MAAAYHANYPTQRIVIILPASLIGNFRKELASRCGDLNFPVNSASAGLNKKGKPDFELFSYQKFVKRIKDKSLLLKDCLVIVDEVQNILSNTGSMYEVFLDTFQTIKGSKLLCLSATPMMDKPVDIALLGNLLLTREEAARSAQGQIPTDPIAFDDWMQNPRRLQLFFRNKVSYFKRVNRYMYPSKVEHVVKCYMSSFQKKVYMKSIGHNNRYENTHRNTNNDDVYFPRAFLTAQRQLANLVIPDCTIGKLVFGNKKNTTFDIKKHSTKFFECLQNIAKAEGKGPVVVYSNFVSLCGIEAFSNVLWSIFYQTYPKLVGSS